MKLELLKKGKNRLKIKTKSAVLDNSIRANFTVPNKKARHSPYATATSCPISLLGSFKTGLALDVIDFVKNKFPDCEIDYSSVEHMIYPFKVNRKNLHSLPNIADFEQRDYQDEAVRLALANGRGVFEMATASGKSLIITKLIHNIWLSIGKKKVLILVPTVGLVVQFYKDILEYGIAEKDISMFSSSNSQIDTNANIIISNRQWLEKHSKKLPKDIEVTIIDECIKKGQQVKTIDGNKNIEDIEVGDLVLSYNIDTKVQEYKSVLKTFINLYKSQSYNHFLQIELDDGRILEVTPNHKIYTINRGYVRADNLTEDDDISIF